jgi:threonine-phosphate decarboxylase
MIEGHGDDKYLYGSLLHSDFSSNVSSRHVQAPIQRFLSEHLSCLASYPEPDSAQLRHALATFHSVSPEQVLVTNGSVEAFYLLAAAFRSAQSLVFTPSFAEYEDACRMHAHQLHFEDNGAFETVADLSKFDLVWLANPNNPDGRILSGSTLQEKLERWPNTVFIVDEAYVDLCPAAHSVVEFIHRYNNLVVVQSMTKQFVLPGLRLGYLLTGKQLSKRLKRFQLPWSVNALAQQVGLFLTKDWVNHLPDVHALCASSLSLQARLSMFPKVSVLSSSCPFFLVRIETRTAASLKSELIQSHGILVRDASNFRGLDDHFIRLSVQKDEENERLCQAFQLLL